MTSIERTAYPRFGRVVTVRELGVLWPLAEEIRWARERTRSDEHLLALLVALKCFQRLGYFPAADQVPEVVIGHVRRCLGLSEATAPEAGQRTAAWQRELVGPPRVNARNPTSLSSFWGSGRALDFAPMMALPGITRVAGSRVARPEVPTRAARARTVVLKLHDVLSSRPSQTRMHALTLGLVHVQRARAINRERLPLPAGGRGPRWR